MQPLLLTPWGAEDHSPRPIPLVLDKREQMQWHQQGKCAGMGRSMGWANRTLLAEPDAQDDARQGHALSVGEGVTTTLNFDLWLSADRLCTGCLRCSSYPVVKGHH